MDEALHTFSYQNPQSARTTLNRPKSAYNINSRPVTASKTAISLNIKTRPSTAGIKSARISKNRNLDIKDLESHSMNWLNEWNRMSKTARGSTSSRNSLAFVLGETQPTKSRPMSAAYPLPEAKKVNPKLNYAINAFPLYKTLRKLEETDVVDQIAIENAKMKLIDERFLNKFKQNISPEQILMINANDPNSMSARYLELIHQDKLSKPKTRSEIPVYKPPPPQPKPEIEKSEKYTNKYKDELIFIWNKTTYNQHEKKSEEDSKKTKYFSSEAYFKQRHSIEDIINGKNHSDDNFNNPNDNKETPLYSPEEIIPQEINTDYIEERPPQSELVLSTKSLKPAYSSSIKPSQDCPGLIAVGTGVKIHSSTHSKHRWSLI